MIAAFFLTALAWFGFACSIASHDNGLFRMCRLQAVASVILLLLAAFLAGAALS